MRENDDKVEENNEMKKETNGRQFQLEKAERCDE